MLRSETLAGLDCGHTGVIEGADASTAPQLAIDLDLGAARGYRPNLFSELGVKIPIEFGPRGGCSAEKTVLREIIRREARIWLLR